MVAIPSQNIYILIDWKKVIVHFRKSAGLVPTTTTPWREFPARSGRTRLQSSPGSPRTPQRRPTEDICRPCGQNEKVCQLLCYSSSTPRDFYFFMTVHHNIGILTPCETAYFAVIRCLSLWHNGCSFNPQTHRFWVRILHRLLFSWVAVKFKKLIFSPKLIFFFQSLSSEHMLEIQIFK